MKMPKPAYTGIQCPNCDARCNIGWRDGGAYWFKATVWTCPHCHDSFNTATLQEYNTDEAKLTRAQETIAELLTPLTP